MSNAVPRRTEKPVTIQSPKSAKARILKFDRHAGVIVLDRAEPRSRMRSLSTLVRKLLTILKPNGPSSRMKQTRGEVFRLKGDKRGTR